MLLFRKTESVTGTASIGTYLNAKVHTNNYVADNGLEIVRNIGNFKKFKFDLCEN